MAARRRQEGHREHVGSRQQILLDCTGRSSSGSLADTVSRSLLGSSPSLLPTNASSHAAQVGSCGGSGRPLANHGVGRGPCAATNHPAMLSNVKVSRTSQPVFSFRSSTVQSRLSPLRSPAEARHQRAEPLGRRCLTRVSHRATHAAQRCRQVHCAAINALLHSSFALPTRPE